MVGNDLILQLVFTKEAGRISFQFIKNYVHKVKLTIEICSQTVLMYPHYTNN